MRGDTKMKKYYLAYGSNLNIAQMQFRCPDATVVGTAVIPDYELLQGEFDRSVPDHRA